MVKKRTVKVYEFNELPEDVREKVLDEWRNVNVEDDIWYDYVYDNWHNKLAEYGFNDVKINFSGFWSQGDGASFVTKNIDTDKYIKKNYSAGNKMMSLVGKSDDFGIFLTRNDHRYFHANTVSVDYYYEGDSDKEDALVRELADEIETHARELMREIYNDLREVYEEETSDERITEMIVANDYLFTKDGKLFSD